MDETLGATDLFSVICRAFGGITCDTLCPRRSRPLTPGLAKSLSAAVASPLHLRAGRGDDQSTTPRCGGRPSRRRHLSADLIGATMATPMTARDSDSRGWSSPRARQLGPEIAIHFAHRAAADRHAWRPGDRRTSGITTRRGLMTRTRSARRVVACEVRGEPRYHQRMSGSQGTWCGALVCRHRRITLRSCGSDSASPHAKRPDAHATQDGPVVGRTRDASARVTRRCAESPMSR